MGFEVDSNNKPAPEKIPTVDGPHPAPGGLYEGLEWGWDGINQTLKLRGAIYNGPLFTKWTPQQKTFLEKLMKIPWIMEQDANEQQKVCAIHLLMKAPPCATKGAWGRWVCNLKLWHRNYPCTVKKCGKPAK